MSTPEETISVNSPKLSLFRAIVPKTVQKRRPHLRTPPVIQNGKRLKQDTDDAALPFVYDARNRFAHLLLHVFRHRAVFDVQLFA